MPNDGVRKNAARGISLIMRHFPGDRFPGDSRPHNPFEYKEEEEEEERLKTEEAFVEMLSAKAWNSCLQHILIAMNMKQRHWSAEQSFSYQAMHWPALRNENHRIPTLCTRRIRLL